MVELWALRNGLVLAKEMGLNNLVIELDPLSVVILMNNGSENLSIEPLLTDCKNLLKEIPNILMSTLLIQKEGQKAIFSGLKIGNQSIQMVWCKIPNLHQNMQ